MQSFLQYRSFGKHVEAQHERDRGKAIGATSAGGRRNFELPSTTNGPEPRESIDSSLASIHSMDTEDAEKSRNPVAPGILDPGHSSNACANALDLEKAESRLDPRKDGAHLGRDQSLSTQPTRDLERTGTALGVALTGIHVRTRTTHEGKGQEGLSQKVFVVGYEGIHDPLNPHNWSLARRIFCTMMIASIGFVVGVASSIDSSALRKAAADFGVSEVVESMAVGMATHVHGVVSIGRANVSFV